MKKAFTLIELIIVVIIVGILVSIAMPKFTFVAERAKAAEGVEILGSIRRAQIRYFSLHNDYAMSINEIDIEIPQMKFFLSTSPMKWENPPGGGTIVGIAQRERGIYALFITEAGEIRCGGAANYCNKLGYPSP
ncbi:MAG: prepilin-type N-terminal cleavage/methylation domain-containing protein [Candidatus Omnitrophota bacterium]